MTQKSMVPVAPVHAGEVLGAEFLAPLGLSAAELARRAGVPANRISAIVAAALGTIAAFLMNLQKGWAASVVARSRLNLPFL